ncbi:hypothetical protein GON01_09270 [Sphingomonas sp. MAH-20]|uniref:Uncharacterized protein n=1 Tax=Sphingomonas horti TaxID=2682842 RepID=A0A6I4J0M1_9SPHN|nr:MULTISPECIES: hypothetical protein [Sphingomonas]MBA2920989.1 hypothetical protein [Sphingomonas sp. CGMCC 1.13658]MVO78122.1 hypothetical protein [Sphingomonas horti]
MNLQPTEHEAADLMTRHGITRVQAVQYRYKSWRYSNLSDAVAQAERDASAQLDDPTSAYHSLRPHS